MGLFRLCAGIAIVFAVVRAGEDTPAAATAGTAATVQAASETVRSAADFCANRPELCVTMAAAGMELARKEAGQRLSALNRAPAAKATAPSGPPKQSAPARRSAKPAAKSAAAPAGTLDAKRS